MPNSLHNWEARFVAWQQSVNTLSDDAVRVLARWAEAIIHAETRPMRYSTARVALTTARQSALPPVVEQRFGELLTRVYLDSRAELLDVAHDRTRGETERRRGAMRIFQDAGALHVATLGGEGVAEPVRTWGQDFETLLRFAREARPQSRECFLGLVAGWHATLPELIRACETVLVP